MTHIQRLIENLSSDRVYIQTHNFPDADAISCAYGLRVLLAKYGIRATICFKNKQDNFSTQLLVEKFHINLLEIGDDLSESRLDDSAEIIIVDSQRGNSNISDIGGQDVGCIDHHPISDRADYKYYDIRAELGSCATIICEYFLEEGVPFHKKTATLLTYGIRTDTSNLSRGVHKHDLEMLTEIYDATDHGLIRLLENSLLKANELSVYSKTLDKTNISGSFSFSYAGENCTDLLISHICDFMLSIVEIDLSITCTLRENGIKLSIRSSNPKINAGLLSQLALRGIGSGGGHPTMAGAFVPLAKRTYLKRFLKEIEYRFFYAASKMVEYEEH